MRSSDAIGNKLGAGRPGNIFRFQIPLFLDQNFPMESKKRPSEERLITAKKYPTAHWKGDIPHGGYFVAPEAFIAADGDRPAVYFNRECAAIAADPRNEIRTSSLSEAPVEKTELQDVDIPREFVDRAVELAELRKKVDEKMREFNALVLQKDPADFRSMMRGYYLQKKTENVWDDDGWTRVRLDRDKSWDADGNTIKIAATYQLGTDGHQLVRLGDGSEHEVMSLDEYHTLANDYEERIRRERELKSRFMCYVEGKSQKPDPPHFKLPKRDIPMLKVDDKVIAKLVTMEDLTGFIVQIEEDSQLVEVKISHPEVKDTLWFYFYELRLAD